MKICNTMQGNPLKMGFLIIGRFAFMRKKFFSPFGERGCLKYALIPPKIAKPTI